MNRTSLRTLVVLSALLSVGLSMTALSQDTRRSGQDELPDNEKDLLQYVQRNSNWSKWRLAEKGAEKYIKDYPEGKNLEQIYWQMGYIHQHFVRRYAESREWYTKIVEGFPKGRLYWNARQMIAQSYASQRLKNQAIDEYEKIVKDCPKNMKSQMIRQIWNLQNKYLYLYVSQSFTTGEEPFVQINGNNIDDAKLRLYRIPYDEIRKHLDDAAPSIQQAMGKVDSKNRKLIKEWNEEFKEKRRWFYKKLVLPQVDQSGVYVVEAEHERLTMVVNVFVNKYGVITKSSAGKLLVFAQDRTTGRPAEGMQITIMQGKDKLVGKTDATGLFETKNFTNTAVLIGDMEGEIVAANPQYYNRWGMQQGAKKSLYYIVTDRPIYRPNNKVHFKVIHRVEEGLKLSIKEGTEVRVEIADPKGNKVYEKEHTLNAFGSTEGELTLGDSPSLGMYRVTVLPKGQKSQNQYYYYWGYYGFPNTGQFRVDEYRKPEYKVDVKFEKANVLQGEDIKATVQADYYFGSPVPDAKVEYTIYRRWHWSYWRWWSYYYDWYFEEGEDYYGFKRDWRWYGMGQVVKQGTGRTDAQGAFQITHPGEKHKYDAYYTIVAKVTDLSRRTVDGSAGVVASRAEFNLHVQLDKYVYKPGQRVHAKIRAMRPDNTPVKNQKIRVKALTRNWTRKNKKWDETQVFEGEARTNEHGIADININVEEKGSIIIRAESLDGRENDVEGQAWVWIADETWGGQYMNWNGIDVIPDKRAYKAGDTATILLTSQQKNMHVLLTLEGKEVHHRQVVRIKGHTKTVDIKLDRPEFAPNVYVSVMALHGNQMYQKMKSIVVDPSERFINLTIKPDKDQYRPRDAATVEVTATDKDGNPVQAEVTLGVVDESIYALQDELTPDIRRFFIHRKVAEVNSSSSLYYWQGGVDKLNEEKEANAAPSANAPGNKAEGRSRGNRELSKKGKMDGAGGGGAKKFAATEIRSNFADTMFWTPSVVTDENGKATIRIPKVADNLTTWRITARAQSGGTMFGQQTSKTLVRKDVIVRLHTPRFFTQGDKTTVSAVVHNYLESEKQVRVQFEATGINVTGEKEFDLTVPSKGEKRVDWPATLKGAGKAVITVKALTDEDSDAMKLTVPVLPHGSIQWKSKAGILSDRITEKIHIPEDAIANATELLVVVSPTHASTVLDALDYLAGYPYGCVEQTMSRFLPSAITRQVLQKLGIRKPGLEKELPDMINVGLQRLYNFQHPDGGWGWWKHDKSNPFISAYVMFGLAMARESDVRVDANVLNKGIAALRRHIKAAKTVEEKSYLLYALAMCGQKDDVVRNKLADNVSELTAVAKAMLSFVLHKQGEKKEAKRILESLAADADEGGATAFYAGQSGYRWTGHALDATSLALKSFVAIDPDHALVPKLVGWLSTHRTGHYWVSTRQTAMVVYAMSDYIAHTGELNPDMTISLKLNGDAVYAKKVTKENWRDFQGTVKFTADQFNTGNNEITLEKTGNGSPVYSIYLKYFNEKEEFEASKGGIRIEREYHRVSIEGGKRILERLDDGETVKSGEEIQVTLHVNADQEYRYLMIEDPMPSGFEAVREKPYHGYYWNYWYANKEYRDEKVEIAVTYLPRGRRTVTYTMRAETPGEFKILPTLVWNMYRPEEGGNSAGFSIKVVDDE